jgi:hypothetical protein
MVQNLDGDGEFRYPLGIAAGPRGAADDAFAAADGGFNL